jgi:SAM-dependent methyltransferase
MLNKWPRYFPLLRLLEDHRAGSVLEIGSGSTGLAAFWDGDLVGCDVLFPEPPHPDLLPVIASGRHLPFESESFDLVVCQDTLEHLPPEGRGELIREAVRVARRLVYVSFPRGRGAALADRLYALFHRRLRRLPLPEWLDDHLAMAPVDKEAVRFGLAAFGRVEGLGNENLAIHLVLLLAEHWPRLNRRLVGSGGSQPRFVRWLVQHGNVPPTYRQVYVLDKSNAGP